MCEDVSSDITVATAQKQLECGQPLATEAGRDYKIAKELGKGLSSGQLFQLLLC